MKATMKMVAPLLALPGTFRMLYYRLLLYRWGA